MANIRVDLDYTLQDGAEIKFRSPVDCSQITGLIVYYPGADGNTVSKVFTLADAHGSNVGDIDHLFAEDVVVKVILDVTKGMAFVQNADTNAYLEAQLASKAPAGYGLGATALDSAADLNAVVTTGWCAFNTSTANAPYTGYGVVETIARNSDTLVQRVHDLIHSYSGYYNYGVSVERVFRDGAWQPWEYINPPMKPGKEYRTTERYNGKPVYTQLVDFGALPNTDRKDVYFVSDGSIDNTLDIHPIYYSTTVDMYYSGTVIEVDTCYLCGDRRVAIITNADASHITAMVKVKYTKR